MPHLTIEYSANLEARVEIAKVVEAVHQAAFDTGVFPIGGIRTRAARRDIYAIADRDPDYAFVHLGVRIAQGRDQPTKERVAEALFGALCDGVAEAYNASPLAISFELTEIEPAYSRKKNNIHDLLKAKAEGEAS